MTTKSEAERRLLWFGFFEELAKKAMELPDETYLSENLNIVERDYNSMFELAFTYILNCKQAFTTIPC